MTNIYQPIWINLISKDWEELIFNEYMAGPEGQPNIGCCPRGPAKVCWVIYSFSIKNRIKIKNYKNSL